jgi:hypothetical protein
MTALNSSIGNLNSAIKSTPFTSDVDLSKIDRSDPRLAYNRDSKASIPSYNIKATYNQQISPFFSPRIETSKLSKSPSQTSGNDYGNAS